MFYFYVLAIWIERLEKYYGVKFCLEGKETSPENHDRPMEG